MTAGGHEGLRFFGFLNGEHLVDGGPNLSGFKPLRSALRRGILPGTLEKIGPVQRGSVNLQQHIIVLQDRIGNGTPNQFTLISYQNSMHVIDPLRMNLNFLTG